MISIIPYMPCIIDFLFLIIVIIIIESVYLDNIDCANDLSALWIVFKMLVEGGMGVRMDTGVNTWVEGLGFCGGERRVAEVFLWAGVDGDRRDSISFLFLRLIVLVGGDCCELRLVYLSNGLDGRGGEARNDTD